MESNSNKSSVTLSCRFDRKLYELLQNDCQKKDISLNSLMNSIVKKYLSWEKYAEEIGFIPLAKETVRLVFDNLDDAKIQMIAEHVGRTIPKELILLMFNRIDFDTIMNFIDISSSRYGIVQHDVIGSDHTLTVYHGVNKKFSSFLYSALKTMAKELSFGVELLNMDPKIFSVRIKENSKT